jgi:hypothetical protein
MFFLLFFNAKKNVFFKTEKGIIYNSSPSKVDPLLTGSVQGYVNLLGRFFDLSWHGCFSGDGLHADCGEIRWSHWWCGDGDAKHRSIFFDNALGQPWYEGRFREGNDALSLHGELVFIA